MNSDTRRFDKSSASFPIKDSLIPLSHCAVSPLFSGAYRAQQRWSEEQMRRGSLVFGHYDEVLHDLRRAAAALMSTAPENLSFVKNTSEAMSMIANGYPFEQGDAVVTYVNEYPANFYPWLRQRERGVELVELPDRDVLGMDLGEHACGWTFDDLDRMMTDRTRIVAVSHVQFTSGFAADLKRLGAFCRERDVDLVVDVAQSLGCMPFHPDELGVAAAAASGWKWLLGPLGAGLMYTSPAFREKLGHVNLGAEVMTQGTDYLDHTWHPHHTAKRFEYSTSSMPLAAALEACLSQLHLRYGVDNIFNEVQQLQAVVIERLDPDRFAPLVFSDANRSGILAIRCKGADPAAVAAALGEQSVQCTARGGYLRIAPHFYVTHDEMERAVEVLNTLPA